jgi:Bacterial extracellular solute-binding protein
VAIPNSIGAIQGNNARISNLLLDRMNRTIKALITAGLLVVLGGAIFWALRGTQQEQIASGQSPTLNLPGLRAMQTVELSGLIALDVEPFFKDARVIKVLADNNVKVNVNRIGSRDMAQRVVATAGPDFMFPSGIVAANQVIDAAKRSNLTATQYTVFFTPMVIASWQPIAGIFQANGLTTPLQPNVYSVDLSKLVAMMQSKTRWKDLKGNQAYDVNKSVLVSTTDVRKSNSAAMYMALAAYALNNNELLTDRVSAEALAKKVADLFKRQGYQENYVNGNFDDYTAIGIGKTPLAFIYENQMVAYALTKPLQLDMVLMYPRPTIVNKVVYVALNERSKKLGELLSTSSELQTIGLDYGFRIADSAAFLQKAQSAKLSVDEKLSHLIDPPSFETMSTMIDAITREMSQ